MNTSYCSACGSRVSAREYRSRPVISDALASAWKLTARQRKHRDMIESLTCPACGSSWRSRALAEGIMRSFPFVGATHFDAWVDAAARAGMTVAEINYCGNLHMFLKRLPGLVLSQYDESTLRARIGNWLKGIRREDISQLSYADRSFDLVVHSEVLEHVFDADAALRECRRVLKPGGYCIFTTPVLMGRRTVRRAVIADGDVRHLRTPSYHASGETNNLVVWEFGGDFVRRNGLDIVYAEPAEDLYVFRVSSVV